MLRRPAFLEPFEGEWVAHDGCTVHAHAPAGVDLVPLVRALDERTQRRVLVEYVAPPTDSWLVV